MSVSAALIERPEAQLPIRRERNALADYIRQPECKRLVNRIYTAQNQLTLKSIVVLSQYSEDGNAIFISSLAMGYVALLNKRVLIVDCVSQTRAESFYYRKILEKSSRSERTEQSKKSCIDLITTKNIERDYLSISRDNQNVADLYEDSPYDSADFKVAPLLNDLKKDYDLILIDTCPLNDVDQDCFDPLILALYADASIVVTAPESLERNSIASFTQQLKRHHVTPLGFVVNSGMM